MGLFHHSKKHRESADPLEDATEVEALERDGLLAPEVGSAVPIVNADPSEGDISEEALRATADPEDDAAREMMIDHERRAEERDI